MKQPEMLQYSDRRIYHPETIDESLHAEILSKGKRKALKVLGGLALMVVGGLVGKFAPEIKQIPLYQIGGIAAVGAGTALALEHGVNAVGYLAYRVAHWRYPKKEEQE